MSGAYFLQLHTILKAAGFSAAFLFIYFLLVSYISIECCSFAAHSGHNPFST